MSKKEFKEKVVINPHLAHCLPAKLRLSDLEFEQEIGSGSFATVYLFFL